jgi:hypothetical protein
MKDLEYLLEQDSASDAQKEVFRAPRPVEELYLVADDPFQQNNLADDPAHAAALEGMRRLLKEWQSVTGDTEPESITPDWYLRKADSYVQTGMHSVRGEMPGASRRADTITASGPF